MLRLFIFLSLLLGANTFSNQEDYHSEIFELEAYKETPSACVDALTTAE